MSAKLEKLGVERDKARMKRDEWDAKFESPADAGLSKLYLPLSQQIPDPIGETAFADFSSGCVPPDGGSTRGGFQDLDQRYKEQENEEIHDMVHAYHLSLQQLSVLLSAAKAGAPDPENMEQIMGDSEADSME